MLFAAIIVVALVGSGRVLGSEEKSCKFTLQTDLDSKKEPLVFLVKETEIKDFGRKVEQLEIAYPEVNGRQGVITVDNDKQLLLACTGKGNANRGSGKESAYVSCKNGKFMIGNRRGNKDMYDCTRSYAWSNIKITEEECGKGDETGVILELGFSLNDKSWYPFVQVCHNIKRSVTLYSSHAVHGHSLKGAVKSTERRKFERGDKELFPGFNPDSKYPKRGQEAAFDTILGKNGHDLYINSTSFLARGHLAPDADFIYNSGQLLTYYYVNVAPQWQNFNAGNWLSIENAVRDLAVKVDETINVHTGTYGVLKLNNAQGDSRMMYLVPNSKQLPVPEVYWKIVQHPLSKSCTVAIGHNNVFLKEEPKPICTEAYPDGWPHLHNLTRGYTYYCNYDDFKDVVEFAPNVDCKDLFEFPRKTE